MAAAPVGLALAAADDALDANELIAELRAEVADAATENAALVTVNVEDGRETLREGTSCADVRAARNAMAR